MSLIEYIEALREYENLYKRTYQLEHDQVKIAKQLKRIEDRINQYLFRAIKGEEINEYENT